MSVLLLVHDKDVVLVLYLGGAIVVGSFQHHVREVRLQQVEVEAKEVNLNRHERCGVTGEPLRPHDPVEDVDRFAELGERLALGADHDEERVTQLLGEAISALDRNLDRQRALHAAHRVLDHVVEAGRLEIPAQERLVVDLERLVDEAEGLLRVRVGHHDGRGAEVVPALGKVGPHDYETVAVGDDDVLALLHMLDELSHVVAAVFVPEGSEERGHFNLSVLPILHGILQDTTVNQESVEGL